jgi:hypothetical protein
LVSVNDVAVMRKSHPCGSSEWRVTRVGADIGLRCNGCQRKIMLTREAFEKGARHLRVPAEDSAPDLWNLSPSPEAGEGESEECP